jgi:uridine kinase
MKVCFLITGIPRRFSKYLYVYIQSLEKYLDFDVYLYFPKENCDENYANDIFQKQTLFSILENPRYKLVLLDSQEPSLPDSLSRKQKNCILQWYRIEKCFQFIPSDIYDLVIRVRPDIEFLLNPQVFASLLYKLPKDSITVPLGYEEESHLNDHLAVGSYEYMKVYAHLFSELFINTSFTTSSILQNHFDKHLLRVYRKSIPYKLALSDCKVIAIAGDSASGKSTLMNYIQDIMPRNSSLCIETDSYHKWERGDENWKQYTHLHPDANHLERMSEDVLRLKIGNNVAMVEYDHSTGKFTQEKLTKGKPFLLLCGLHTLYTKTILNQFEVKIFLDTHESLKTEWKVKRDVCERNHPIDKVLESISKRKHDSDVFILPQKNHANFIIEYKHEDDVLVVDIVLAPLLSGVVHPFTDFFSASSSAEANGMIRYRLRSTVSSEAIRDYLQNFHQKLFYIPSQPFQDGITGILQLLVFLFLFYENEHF